MLREHVNIFRNYNYEVMCYIKINTNKTTATIVKINDIERFCADAYSTSNVECKSCNLSVTVDSSRSFTFAITGSVTSLTQFDALCYRRIGTNS